jgi:hypothetical protein
VVPTANLRVKSKATAPSGVFSSTRSFCFRPQNLPAPWYSAGFDNWNANPRGMNA